MSKIESDNRPLQPEGLTSDNAAPLTGERNRHCYDAEKCNADTFCDCPCVSCMRMKRGEFSTR